MDRLYRGDPEIAPSIPEKVLRKLVSLCVCNNTFVFNNKVYNQIDGVAMGSSLGPVLANIWMSHLEETYIFGNEFFPSFYCRYVDDTFCIFRNPAHISKFHDHLNSLSPSTKFDIEMELDGKLAFLDTVVGKDSNSRPEISTKVKATDKGLYYDYNFFISERYKLNLVRCLIYRIASSFNIFHSDLERLCNKLYKNGFPKRLVLGSQNDCVAKVLDSFYVPQVPQTTVRRQEVVMILPYLGHMSIALKRDIIKLVRKFYPAVDLRIIFKRGFQLSTMFNFRDRLPLKCSSGVVYSINCKKCGQSAAYIGKTKNTLHERFYGSNGHLNPRTANSPLLNHMCSSLDNECGFEFDSIRILDSSSVDYRLRIIESAYLKYEKQTLNTQEYSFPLKLL